MAGFFRGVKMIHGAVFDLVAVPPVQCTPIQFHTSSGAFGNGDYIVGLAKGNARDDIGDLPTEQALAGLVYPGHGRTHVQVGGRANAGVAAVAPEAHAHGFTGADKANGSVDAAQYGKVDHDEIGNTQGHRPADIRDMGREGDR
jgi:hypothetical protein